MLVIIRNIRSTYNRLGRFASSGVLCGSNRSGPPAAKSEAYTSFSLYLSLPCDIIDSDCTVRSWLLPLLHDSRLRTRFPRYDKQHDASDACNVADIMHMCRWYGTKRQDVFSNDAITIVVDARGKARRRVRISVETEENASVVYVPSTQNALRNDVCRELKCTLRLLRDEENPVTQLITRSTCHFQDVLNYLRNLYEDWSSERKRRTTYVNARIIILIIQREEDTYMRYTYEVHVTWKVWKLLLRMYDENTRFLDVLKIRCLGSQRSVRAHIRYQTRRQDALSRMSRREETTPRAGLAGKREKYSNHRRNTGSHYAHRTTNMRNKTASPRLSVRWNHPPLKYAT